MKLYIYEHCPFCSRVQYIARKLGVDLEEVVVGYDDVETPTALIGKKMVPILVKDNGEVMAESGDIIAYLLDIKMSDEIRTPSKQALDWQSEAFYTLLRVGYPRWSQLKLGEFSTKESRAAWVERKQSDTMNFAGLIEQTNEIVTETNAFLKETEEQLTFKDGNADISLVDQAVYFSLLRGYCCEPSVQWPLKLQFWMENMSRDSGIPPLK